MYDVITFDVLYVVVRWFWLSWRDGLIQFGRGVEPGLDVILWWQDDTGGHVVQSIGISTAMTESGLFEFMNIPSNTE